MFEIVEKYQIGPGVNRAVISAPEIARAHHPGQFIILRSHPDGERIPLTVADKDVEKGTITLIWQEVGTTTYFLGSMKVGERLADLCGPLGKPTHVEKFGYCCLCRRRDRSRTSLSYHQGNARCR